MSSSKASDEGYPDEDAIFTEDDIDGIFKVAAKTLPKVDVTRTKACHISRPLVNSLTKGFGKEPEADLGSFNKLPLELIYNICQELDVKSSLALRQVNRCSREIVTSLIEYNAVTTHALGVVQAVIWSGIGSRVTFPDLYRLFSTHECMVCSAPESSDSYRFYDSRAPKHRPKIAPGVKGLEVGQAALEKTVMDKPPKFKVKPKRAVGQGANAKEETPEVVLKEKKYTALNILSMADTSGNRDGTRYINAHEKAAGRYLFLPTLTRCCKPCLEESCRMRVIPLRSLTMPTDLALDNFLPHVITPWKPQHKNAFHKKTFAAKRNKIKETKQDEGKKKEKENGKEKGKMDAATFKKYQLSEGMVTRGAASQILLGAGYPPNRANTILYNAGYLQPFTWFSELNNRKDFTVTMSFFDRFTNTASGGYTCKGCDAAIKKLYGHLNVTLVYTNTVFGTRAAFLEHFSACSDAIKLWKKDV